MLRAMGRTAGNVVLRGVLLVALMGIALRAGGAGVTAQGPTGDIRPAGGWSGAQGDIPVSEREALVALYNATHGAFWNDDTHWLTGDPGTWLGVSCEGGHVVTLNLASNNLRGALPAALADLTHMQSLWLYSNQLTGPIPGALARLSALQDLKLGDNQLTGPIPDELGRLTHLRGLDLSSNQLTGRIPAALGDLTNLSELYLYTNQLTGSIPSELGHLANLEWLSLYSNQLTGPIPAELGDLTKLRELHLDDNQLTGAIPPAIGNLANLQWLSLFSNRLTGPLPPELGRLANLQELDLYYNQLTGTLPAELGNLSNLQILNLRANQLAGALPAAWGELATLQSLELEDNALEGEIPPSFAALVNLGANPWDVVDLGYNKLSAAEPAVRAFVDARDPDWADTQTVPPTDLQGVEAGMGRVALSWTPIRYTGDAGYYAVYTSNAPGGPYAQVGTTADKLASGYTVTGLAPGRTLYLAVRSYTPAHGEQTNALWSAYSTEVAATTAPVRVFIPFAVRR